MKSLAVGLFPLILAVLSAHAQTPDVKLTKEVNEIVRETNSIIAEPSAIESGSAKVIEKISKVKLSKFKKSDFKGARKVLIPLIYKARIELRSKMLVINAQGLLNEATARSVERLSRYLRGIEDYLGYVDSDQKKTKPPKQSGLRYITSAGFMSEDVSLLPSDNTLINPAFEQAYLQDRDQLTLKSGDVILSRGSAATSSAIARLGDEDTQFSHVALVYVDPNTKKGYVIEAHIELGVVTSPIETWLQDGKKRSALYRYKDTAIAERAGQLMFEYVTDYKNKYGKNIPYDFSFDMGNESALFCSEVVRKAYSLATDKSVQVPQFPSSLNPKNRSFLEQLGIKVTTSFIPADIEADANFTPLAEWRNFADIHDSWLRDALTTKIYEWMDRDMVKYRPSWPEKLLAKTLVGLRHTPVCEKLFEGKLADNATSDVVGVMLAIESLYGKVMKKLATREAAVIAARGTPFTLLEAMQELEIMRQETPKLFSKLR